MQYKSDERENSTNERINEVEDMSETRSPPSG